MSTLSQVLLQGLRAAQPLATAVPNGSLYFVTDEGVTEQSLAAAWTTYSSGLGVPSGAGAFLVVTTTDEQVDNSAALTDHTKLQHPIAAGETWVYDLALITTITLGGPDLLLTIAGPAAPVVATFTDWWNQTTQDFGVTDDPGAGITPTTFLFRATIANGANAGSVKVQFTQASATAAAPVTILSGSSMVATRKT